MTLKTSPWSWKMLKRPRSRTSHKSQKPRKQRNKRWTPTHPLLSIKTRSWIQTVAEVNNNTMRTTKTKGRAKSGGPAWPSRSRKKDAESWAFLTWLINWLISWSCKTMHELCRQVQRHLQVPPKTSQQTIRSFSLWIFRIRTSVKIMFSEATAIPISKHCLAVPLMGLHRKPSKISTSMDSQQDVWLRRPVARTERLQCNLRYLARVKLSRKDCRHKSNRVKMSLK